MMARSNDGYSIQAFPIHKETFKGTATDLDCGNYSVVHALADVRITFKFNDTSKMDLDIDMVEHMDFGITEDVKSITSTASVLVS